MKGGEREIRKEKNKKAKRTGNGENEEGKGE